MWAISYQAQGEPTSFQFNYQSEEEAKRAAETVIAMRDVCVHVWKMEYSTQIIKKRVLKKEN